MIKKFLLNIYYWPVFLFITVLGFPLLPLILFINVMFLNRTLVSALRRVIRFYGWVLVRVVPFMAPVKIIGKTKKLPLPAIFVANHNSAIDPYLFGALAIENCFVTSWPHKIPIYGRIMRMAGYINIEDGWAAFKRQGLAILESGSSLTVWPEGHRSRTGRLGRFRKGAFELAVVSGRPVVPVCISGAYQILPPGRRLLTPGRVGIKVLSPIYPGPGEDIRAAADELMRKTHKAIGEELNHRQIDVSTAHSLTTGNRPGKPKTHPCQGNAASRS